MAECQADVWDIRLGLFQQQTDKREEKKPCVYRSLRHQEDTNDGLTSGALPPFQTHSV